MIMSNRDLGNTGLAYAAVSTEFDKSAGSDDLCWFQYPRWKSYVERPIAALALILVSPLIAFLALLMRSTSKGPPIFRQLRLGKNGRPFTMYKIRTMVCDAEKATGAIWAARHDPRATRVGQFLRATHLDELPQLLNVIRGDMSFVGPRPERPEFVVQLARSVSGYLTRLSVLPGVTGLAQINLPPDETIDCVRKKVELDREYIVTLSLSVDVRIVLCTLLQLGGVSRAASLRWLRLEQRAEHVEFALEAESRIDFPVPVGIAPRLAQNVSRPPVVRWEVE